MSRVIRHGYRVIRLIRATRLGKPRLSPPVSNRVFRPPCRNVLVLKMLPAYTRAIERSQHFSNDWPYECKISFPLFLLIRRLRPEPPRRIQSRVEVIFYYFTRVYIYSRCTGGGGLVPVTRRLQRALRAAHMLYTRRT